MIDSQSVLYSPGDNDECMTPGYAVEPILKYIPKEAVVWCPFDTVDSEFYKQIRPHTYVVASHLKDGKDFYNWEPPIAWDILISNPPFTNKRKIFERALSFGKPFALLMSLTWLNDAAPKQIFMEKDLQLLMFDKRIKYLNPDGTPMLYKNKKGKWVDKITFSSAYYCWNFLPKQIIMEELKR